MANIQNITKLFLSFILREEKLIFPQNSISIKYNPWSIQWTNCRKSRAPSRPARYTPVIAVRSTSHYYTSDS